MQRRCGSEAGMTATADIARAKNENRNISKTVF
jgi:hypothetical protein